MDGGSVFWICITVIAVMFLLPDVIEAYKNK